MKEGAFLICGIRTLKRMVCVAQFTYQITGYLDTCNVDEIIDPASINNWELY